MSKHKEQPIAEESHFSDYLAENPTVQWISQNGKMLLWIFLALLAAILLLYRLIWGGSQSTENDYLAANRDFSTFETASDPKTQAEALDQLIGLLKRHPNLQSKFDGLAAQTLLNRDAVTQAIPFAERTLTRVRLNHLPFYHDYASTTLLISEKKYAEALKQAQALQSKLIEGSKEKAESKEFGDVLYVFNLLRVAMLQQQLGNKTEELKTWNEFKQAAVLNNEKGYFVQPDLFETILNQLQDGKSSIMNYIEAREKLLK
jgi:hypothetical protein